MLSRTVFALLALVAGCQSEAKVEQACFQDYLDAAAAVDSAYITCDAAGNDTCLAVYDADVASAKDALGACAEDGCVADWIACVDADVESDIQCFDALDRCGGGWVSAGMVDDCQTDANACASATSEDARQACAADYYDCLRYAAGR